MDKVSYVGNADLNAIDHLYKQYQKDPNSIKFPQVGEEVWLAKPEGRGKAKQRPIVKAIDGVPGNMDKINPNDIESVTVLKDAAAAAVYGARAAFGVILVQTMQNIEIYSL